MASSTRQPSACSCGGLRVDSGMWPHRKDKLVVAFGIHEDEEPMNLGGCCVQSVGVCTEPAEDLLTYTFFSRR